MGAGRARAEQRDRHPTGDQLHRERAQPGHPGLPRRGRAGDRRQGLVDVRSPDEFAGRLLAPAHLPQEQAQRGGHIPTAVNVPWSKAANDDGTFKSDEDLKELYSGAGLDLSTDIIAYCRIEERARTPGSCCTRSSASRM